MEINIVAEHLAKKEDWPSPEEMGQSLVVEVRKACKTQALPDEIVQGQGILGPPRLLARKKLSEPVPDAWNVPCGWDQLVIATAVIKGYGGDWEWLFELPPEEEFEGQKFGFLLLSAAEQERILKELSKYVELDCGDVHGPLLGAVHACSLKDDSPSPAWNKRVRQLLQDEQKRMDAWRKKERAKERSEFEALLKPWKGLDFEFWEQEHSLRVKVKVLGHWFSSQKRLKRFLARSSFRFREGRGKKPISSMPSGKIILPARGFYPRVGEVWLLGLDERDRYAFGSPVARKEEKEGTD